MAAPNAVVNVDDTTGVIEDPKIDKPRKKVQRNTRLQSQAAKSSTSKADDSNTMPPTDDDPDAAKASDSDAPHETEDQLMFELSQDAEFCRLRDAYVSKKRAMRIYSCFRWLNLLLRPLRRNKRRSGRELIPPHPPLRRPPMNPPAVLILLHRHLRKRRNQKSKRRTRKSRRKRASVINIKRKRRLCHPHHLVLTLPLMTNPMNLPH